MKRHGPLRLGGVPAAVLHRLEDAEDAFQATFIISRNRAESARGKNSLAGCCTGWRIKLP